MIKKLPNSRINYPQKLLEFKDVFNEVSANTFPPYRSYDCEINIKPDSNLYYGPIYPLTNKELIALKNISTKC